MTEGRLMNLAQLTMAAGCKIELANKWLFPLCDAMQRFYIFTPYQKASFVAQVSHESARLSIVEENLNYSSAGLLSTFQKYFTKELADSYARQPLKIANRVYANRMGNGDEASGDGWKYRGRGLIQITGKDNYVACVKALGISDVSLLTQPQYAALSAGWFWDSRRCNELADREDFAGITKRINGGLNGYPERLALFSRALAAFA